MVLDLFLQLFFPLPPNPPLLHDALSFLPLDSAYGLLCSFLIGHLLCYFNSSFVSQCHNRLDPHRPPRRDIARDQRHHQQKHGNRDKSDGVMRAQPEKQAR